jgi:hypothetical protein
VVGAAWAPAARAIEAPTAGHGGAGRAGNRRCGRCMARWADAGVMASARRSYARASCIVD